MKKSMFMCALLSLLLSCGSSDEERSTDDYYTMSADCNCKEIDVKRNDNGSALKNKSNVYYLISTGELFTGICEEKYGNGKRKWLVQFQDGLQNGQTTMWYEDGQVAEIANFSMGKLHGEKTKWKEGDKERRIYYANYDNGDYVKNGFMYENDILEAAWFILPETKVSGSATKESFGIGGTPEHHASFVFSNAANLDVDKKNGNFELLFQTKIKDDVLISYLEQVLKEHFRNGTNPKITEINIIYSVLNQEHFGYKEQKLEYEAKEKEKIRISNLLINKFPKINIVGFENTLQDGTENVEIETSNSEQSASNALTGTWQGQMSGKNLKIVIESVNGKNIVGYNTLGTTTRKLTGTFSEYKPDCMDCVGYMLTLNEPGDDQWDGVFTIYLIVDGSMNGEWKSNNGKSTKDFTLEKE